MNLHQSALPALFLGPETLLPSQPDRPTGSVLRRRRRECLGATLPNPDLGSAGNDFADLYNDAGTHLTIRDRADLRRLTGGEVVVESVLDSFAEDTPLPQTIEVASPWCIGAAGQQRGFHFAEAILFQLSRTLSTARPDDFGPDDLRACAFTQLCRRGSPEYNVGMASERALRQMSTNPIFRYPKVFLMWQKQVSPDGTTGEPLQAWYPWQVCCNCLATRAVGRCTNWYEAWQIKDASHIAKDLPEEPTEFDRAYGWFTQDITDRILGRDLGYYGPWLCRDGVERADADV